MNDFGYMGGFGPPDVLPAGYGDDPPPRGGSVMPRGTQVVSATSPQTHSVSRSPVPNPPMIPDPLSSTPFDRGGGNLGPGNDNAAPGWGASTPEYLSDGSSYGEPAYGVSSKETRNPPRDVRASDGSVIRQSADGAILVLSSTNPELSKFVGRTLKPGSTTSEEQRAWAIATGLVGSYVNPYLSAASQALVQAASGKGKSGGKFKSSGKESAAASNSSAMAPSTGETSPWLYLGAGVAAVAVVGGLVYLMRKNG